MHAGRLQFLESEFVDPFTSQSSPPYSGAGLLQCRILVWVPWPQVAGHSLHSSHSDQLPCTNNEIRVSTKLGLEIHRCINSYTNEMFLEISIRNHVNYFSFDRYKQRHSWCYLVWYSSHRDNMANYHRMKMILSLSTHCPLCKQLRPWPKILLYHMDFRTHNIRTWRSLYHLQLQFSNTNYLWLW